MSQLRDRQDIAAMIRIGVTNVSAICEATGRSQATVYRVMKREQEGSSMDHSQGAGRPQKLGEREARIIAQNLRRDPSLSAGQLVGILAERGTRVSDWTVKQFLKARGYQYSRPPRGPMISADNKIRRVQWCLQRQEEPRLRWDTVIFADESQVQVHRNTLKLWRKTDSPSKAPIPTQSPRVGMWSAFSSRGVFPIIFYEASLKAPDYCRILSEGLLETARILHPEGFQLVHDNATCHTAAVTKTWLAGNGIQVLPWPASSPDLNPIENLWALLKNRIERRRPRTKAELKQFLEEEWSKISHETLQNLATSLVDRLRLCVEADGCAIRY